MQRALSVGGNEYAVVDSRAKNPRAMTLGVSPCIGVALMLNDAFNTAAVGHFFAHAQTFDNPREAFGAYVEDGFKQMLDAMGWKPGMKVRAGIVGGLPGWGDKKQSELLSEFVHAALGRIGSVEIVFDHSLRGRPEDIVADSKTGEIRSLTDGELGRTLLDTIDTQEWCYSSPKHLARLNGIHAANDNPDGSRLFRHPQSIPAL